MARPKPDKPTLLAGLAAHVLQNGLNTASLRPMAAAVGTSDRMLIYHFGNKTNLMAELLEFLSQNMAAGLESALPERRFDSEKQLITKVFALLRSPELRPYTRAWFDIVSATAHDATLPPGIGKTILQTYLAWIAKRHPQGEAAAAKTLALIEGLLVMDTVGCTEIVDQILAALDT